MQQWKVILADFFFFQVQGMRNVCKQWIISSLSLFALTQSENKIVKEKKIKMTYFISF